jgi:hypothetical protein
MKLGKSLTIRATIEGKSGVFNISDMSSFFLSERIETLMEYERSLRKMIDLKFKAYVHIIKATLADLPKSSRTRCSQHIMLLLESRVEADRLEP